jgi:transcriptional antiterminator RfaH
LTHEVGFKPGARIEIISGPLAGMEGTILRQGKQLKFYVAVHFLQQGVSAEVESWMIRPLATPQHAVVAG